MSKSKAQAHQRTEALRYMMQARLQILWAHISLAKEANTVSKLYFYILTCIFLNTDPEPEDDYAKYTAGNQDNMGNSGYNNNQGYGGDSYTNRWS